MTRMIIASIALGIAGAGVAMALLMHTTIRRIRELESNAAALGDGRPLTAIAHSKDELGRLGRGLDQAAVLLHDRDRALRESEERLELALEAADFGTFDVNLTTGQTVWSERAELIHGLPAGGFNGEFDGWIACIHPDDREAVAAAANAPISVGCYRWIEYRVRLADGSMRWVSNRGMGICDELGTPVRIVGTTADVTESKLVQQQLEDMRDSAEHANQSKSEFLSRVSHELRTPLNAILGFGQLLDMDDLTDSQQESVDQVLRGGRHLLALIDDILDISRIESGNLAVSLEPVLVDELIAETISLTRPLAVDQAVTVANANHGSGLFVRADRRRLKQILLNLASNAVKYNVPGGTVTFSVVGTADDVVIAVTDTGIGIREDQLDRVFTPFDRLDADKSGVQGTGMGLALSRSFAELLGGELIATSDFGDGSTFSLRLNRIGDPLHGIKHDEVDASPCVASDAASSFAEGHRRETILHVEDNPSNRKLVEQMLSRRPELRLLAAETVAGALEIARTETLDLVLLDMHLPDGSGADLIPMLRALPNKADLAVVVVSADATPRQIERTTSFGANAYLTKPLDLAHLLSVLERLLPGVTCS
jgi:PAS domain S-box-containing protein